MLTNHFEEIERAYKTVFYSSTWNFLGIALDSIYSQSIILHLGSGLQLI